jgi:hypothetical protein
MHPKINHHYCFGFFDNNLKAIWNATFFFRPVSLALEFMSELNHWQDCVEHRVWCHGKALDDIDLDPCLFHIIFSFYL